MSSVLDEGQSKEGARRRPRECSREGRASVGRVVGSGFVVMPCTADVGIFMWGEEEVPRRALGSRSVNSETGIGWYPWATKISVPEKTPSRGSMSTR